MEENSRGFLRVCLLVSYRNGNQLYPWGYVLENFYSQVVVTSFLGGAQIPLLLGFVVLLVGLLRHGEVFERLVGPRIRGPLYLVYGSFGLPLMLVLMEIQKTRRGGGLFRIFGLLALLVIVVFIGVLALIAFLIYRYLSRRR
jgi:hypothetical protein